MQPQTNKNLIINSHICINLLKLLLVIVTVTSCECGQKGNKGGIKTPKLSKVNNTNERPATNRKYQ